MSHQPYSSAWSQPCPLLGGLLSHEACVPPALPAPALALAPPCPVLAPALPGLLPVAPALPVLELPAPGIPGAPG